MNLRWRVLILALTASVLTFAQDHSADRKKQFNLDNNLAIDGYDPVAYFKSNKAVKGKKGNVC